MYLLRDGGGTFETRIESLDSTRVEDMVREYFAAADEVVYYIFIKFNICLFHVLMINSFSLNPFISNPGKALHFAIMV